MEYGIGPGCIRTRPLPLSAFTSRYVVALLGHLRFSSWHLKGMAGTVFRRESHVEVFLLYVKKQSSRFNRFFICSLEYI